VCSAVPGSRGRSPQPRSSPRRIGRGRSGISVSHRDVSAGLEHLRCCCGRWNEAELQHCQPVKHQIERDMLAVAEAEDLDIVHFDRAACRRNVPHGTVQNAVLRPRECTFLNCDVVDDVNGFDFDTRIRECSEPTGRRIFFESLSFTQL
jgi:hypothetical protein